MRSDEVSRIRSYHAPPTSPCCNLYQDEFDPQNTIHDPDDQVPSTKPLVAPSSSLKQLSSHLISHHTTPHHAPPVLLLCLPTSPMPMPVSVSCHHVPLVSTIHYITSSETSTYPIFTPHPRVPLSIIILNPMPIRFELLNP